MVEPWAFAAQLQRFVLLCRPQGHGALQVWEFHVKNVGEFLHTGRGGLNETYNILFLFHKVQSLYNAIIEYVLLLFAAAWCLVLFIHHLQSHDIVNILFTFHTI
jgi:hypothetical protein